MFEKDSTEPLITQRSCLMLSIPSFFQHYILIYLYCKIRNVKLHMYFHYIRFPYANAKNDNVFLIIYYLFVIHSFVHSSIVISLFIYFQIPRNDP